MDKTLDIIIPTINRPEGILECLESIAIQTIKPNSVIIVDASETNELEIALQERDMGLAIRYIQSEKGLPYQRNLGLKYSNSEWILFLDDDVVLEADYIKAAFKVLERNPGFSVFTGGIINHGRKMKVNSLLILFQKIFYLSESSIAGFKKSGEYNVNHPSLTGPVEVGVAIGCSSLYHRDIFKDYKFDTNYQYLEGYASLEDEDFSLQLRHQYKILYCTSARALHNRATDPGTRLSVYRRGRIRSFNHRYLYRKHKDFYGFKAFPHFLSCAGMIIEALINMRSVTRSRGLIAGLYLYNRKKKILEQ